MKLWMKRIGLSLGLIALVGFLYAAFSPLPYDELPPQEKWGAGASSVLPAYSGLQREFPAIVIIGILAAIAIPQFNEYQKRAQEARQAR